MFLPGVLGLIYCSSLVLASLHSHSDQGVHNLDRRSRRLFVRSPQTTKISASSKPIGRLGASKKTALQKGPQRPPFTKLVKQTTELARNKVSLLYRGSLSAKATTGGGKGGTDGGEDFEATSVPGQGCEDYQPFTRDSLPPATEEQKGKALELAKEALRGVKRPPQGKAGGGKASAGGGKASAGGSRSSGGAEIRQRPDLGKHVYEFFDTDLQEMIKHVGKWQIYLPLEKFGRLVRQVAARWAFSESAADRENFRQVGLEKRRKYENEEARGNGNIIDWDTYVAMRLVEYYFKKHGERAMQDVKRQAKCEPKWPPDGVPMTGKNGHQRFDNVKLGLKNQRSGPGGLVLLPYEDML